MEEKPIPYIRYNMSRSNAPTLVHIASVQPFQTRTGRYGRFSTTLCGKEYEMDDYERVTNGEKIVEKLCKQCSRLRGEL